MQVGDLIKYRWWVNENGEDDCPYVDPAQKKIQMGILVTAPVVIRDESLREYIKIFFPTPSCSTYDVPVYKIEVINAELRETTKKDCPNPGCYCGACDE